MHLKCRCFDRKGYLYWGSTGPHDLLLQSDFAANRPEARPVVDYPAVLRLEDKKIKAFQIGEKLKGNSR